MGAIIMLGHYEDAQLNPSDHGNSRNNSTLSAQCQVNPAPGAANTNPDATAPRVPVRHSFHDRASPVLNARTCPASTVAWCMMGHRSTYCPSMEAERDQKYEASLAKKHEKNQKINRKNWYEKILFLRILSLGPGGLGFFLKEKNRAWLGSAFRSRALPIFTSLRDGGEIYYEMNAWNQGAVAEDSRMASLLQSTVTLSEKKRGDTQGLLLGMKTSTIIN